MNSTPFTLGYRMPAEWERHEATWLAWPKDPTTFPEGVLDKVELIYVKMIEALAEGEKVNVLVDNKQTQARVSSMLSSTRNVFFHQIRTVDVWMRDYGPIFVKKNTEVALTKWIFNAWGNKYDDLKYDNESGMRVAESTHMNIFEPGIVLEGGAIDTNGRGTCLTTKQCLLNRNRNPQLIKEQIEEKLRVYLGFTNVIWLESGVAGDDTDGHVDDIARFVNENTVVCMIEEDTKDENYQALKTDFELLQTAEDQDGKRINVIPIQMPKRVADSSDGRLPASYANFYIGNSVVLVPTYNDPNDSSAIKTIQDLFPERKVVDINCEPLVWGFGSIHCVTQQQPG